MTRKRKKEFNLSGYIIGALRKIWRWYPSRKRALEKARKGERYKCESCKLWFTRKQVHVDHIYPVVDPIKGWVSWDEYINRLFVPENKIQILCKKKCHKIKTQNENKMRNKNVERRKKISL